MKKRVCILLSGQMRSNGLNSNYTSDNIILESIEKYFLNEKFKKDYDYDVFISTDTIDLNKATIFFGEEHLKNICINEDNWYLKNIEKNIESFEYYKNEYLKIDITGYIDYSYTLFMIYRLLTVYNLMLNYQIETKTNYDYVVKLRPDSELTNDINELFNILETTNKKIISEHDHFVITTYEFSNIFRLIEEFGKYNEQISIKPYIYCHLSVSGQIYPDNVMCYCQEKQFMDNIFYKIKSKNLDFQDCFQGIIYSKYTKIYRGNGVYAHL